MLNYNALIKLSLSLILKPKNFDLSKFAPFVHNNNNILDISEALQDAIYHIERNGNSKIILTDLIYKTNQITYTLNKINYEIYFI